MNENFKSSILLRDNGSIDWATFLNLRTIFFWVEMYTNDTLVILYASASQSRVGKKMHEYQI